MTDEECNQAFRLAMGRIFRLGTNVNTCVFSAHGAPVLGRGKPADRT